MMRYAIVLEKTKNNWAAMAPDIPGCFSTGKTMVETLENVKDAIILHLAGLMDDGDPIPDPVTAVDYVEIPTPMPSAQTHGVIIMPGNEEIKAIREANGLTQQALAKKAGVRQEMISRLESGRIPVTPKMLRRIKGSVAPRRSRSKVHV